MSLEMHDKAKRYALDKWWFGLANKGFGHAVLLAQLCFGYIPWAWAVSTGLYPGSGEVTQSVLFVVLTAVIDFLVELPWEAGRVFWLEDRHGFNKQTLPFFASDQLKKASVSTVLTTVVVVMLLVVIDWAGSNFFLYAWAVTAAISVAMFMVCSETSIPVSFGVCACV